MQDAWKNDQPIYKQLQDKVSTLILNGSYTEGEVIPSVRQVSSELSINHLTVAKAYQGLVDEGLLIKKRGVGMFVAPDARALVKKQEQEKFYQHALPEFIQRLEQLGISPEKIAKINELIKEK